MGKSAQNSANQALSAQGQVAQQQVDLANKQQQFGQDIWNQTAPARTQATNTYMGLAGGNVPGIQKYVAPQINAATGQYAEARKQAQNMGPGAMRDAALRDISLQQAGTNTGIYSGGTADALSRVASMGWGGVGMSTGAMGQASQGLMGASNTYGNQAGAYSNIASQKGGQVSSLIGGLGAMAGGM